MDDINSAGGVDLKIGWENTSNKELKYVYFTVEAYNSVWDKAYCEIRNHNAFTGRSIGPFEPGYSNLYYSSFDDTYTPTTVWEECYYNHTIKYFVLTQVRLIYMDGSEETIGEDAIEYVLNDYPSKLSYSWDKDYNGYKVEYRFKKQFNGQTLSIPSTYNGTSVTSIGYRAFENMKFTSVEMPNNLKYIGASSFSGCSNLREVVIPYGVEVIESFAFQNCSSLIRVTIPNTVTTIDYAAFGGCSNFEIVFEGTPEEWDAIYKDRSWTYNIDSITFSFVGHNSSKDFRYELNEDGQSYSIFGNGQYDSLTIDIPEQFDGKPITKIGSFAFMGYESVTSIVIPDSISYIDTFAFEGCISLSSITIGKNVIEFKPSAIFGCNSLQQINVNTSNQHYQSINGNLYSKDGKTLYRYAAGKTNVSFTIPDCVNEVWGAAFSHCSYLQEVVVGENILSIDGNSFFECSALVSINVSPNNPYYQSIDGNLYSKNGKILLKYANGKTNTIFSIPNGVEEIGECAFECCYNLVEVEFSNSVTKIGYYAFFACESLESVRITKSVKVFDEGSFESCEKLTSIHYDGTKVEWTNIEKFYDEEWGFSWDLWTGDYVVYCTDGNISK